MNLRLHLIFVLCCCYLVVLSQNKPPEAQDDVIALYAGRVDSINVFANDFTQENHSFELKITGSFQCEFEIIVSDSFLVFPAFQEENDYICSVLYRVRDLESNLYSNTAKVKVYVNGGPKEPYKILNSLSTNNFLVKLSNLDSYTSSEIISVKVPRGSATTCISSSPLFICGITAEGDSCLIGDKNVHNWNGFSGGPLGTNFDSTYYKDWYRSWKLCNNDIIDFKQEYLEIGYEIPETIKNWPAKGDLSYEIPPNKTEFEDNNMNGIYEPALGEAPLIQGDEMIMYFLNDVHPNTPMRSINSMGLEIIVKLFAFDCDEDSTLFNTFIKRYEITNKSDNIYYNTILGEIVDFNIGADYDDYVGTDSVLNAVFAYNSDNDDGSYSYHYKENPPAFASVFLNKKMASSIAFNKNALPGGDFYGIPKNKLEYFNALQGRWNDGKPLTYGGFGHDGDVGCNYIYPGDPNKVSEWSEYAEGHITHDRMIMANTEPFIFYPDSTFTIEIAYVFARDYINGHMGSVTLLKERVAKLRDYYNNDTIPFGVCIPNTDYPNEEPIETTFYPNPALDKLFISNNFIQNVDYVIYDLLGNIVLMGSLINDEINIQPLKSGIYFLKLSDNKNQISAKFIKQ